MSFPSQKLLVALSLVLTLAGLGYLVVAQGGDLWTPSHDAEGQAESDQEQHRQEDLEAQRAHLFTREQLRRQVVEALIDRRLAVVQAASWFVQLDSGGLSPLAYMERVAYFFPGKSPEERLCRKVIEEVRATLEEDRHESARRVVRHLERELERELRRSGSIQLPRAPQPYRAVRATAE
jgi:hypothetical protein